MRKILEAIKGYFTLNRLKYWLGKEVILRVGNKYAVSGRVMFMRYYVDNKSPFRHWTSMELVWKYCLTDTPEEAQAVLHSSQSKIKLA